MSRQTMQPHNSSMGCSAFVIVLIAYLGSVVLSFIPYVQYVAWALPLVLFFVEKQSWFVKFHSIQAFLLNLAGLLIGLIIGWIIGLILAGSYTIYGAVTALRVATFVGIAISVVMLVFSIIALVNASRYEVYEIPLLGKLARKMTAAQS